MTHKHEGDIDSEMFEGGTSDEPIYTCMYCGIQLDKDGVIIYRPKTEVSEL